MTTEEKKESKLYFKLGENARSFYDPRTKLKLSGKSIAGVIASAAKASAVVLNALKKGHIMYATEAEFLAGAPEPASEEVEDTKDLTDNTSNDNEDNDDDDDDDENNDDEEDENGEDDDDDEEDDDDKEEEKNTSAPAPKGRGRRK